MGKYFKISEFTKSQKAVALGINNTPNQAQTAAIELLIAEVLDPLRESFGQPILVTSGFRCAALNKAIGGAKYSQHCSGQAADIVPKDRTQMRKLFDLCRKADFDQLIWEYGNDVAPEWIHVSFRGGNRNRHQVLKAIKNAKGKTEYQILK